MQQQPNNSSTMLCCKRGRVVCNPDVAQCRRTCDEIGAPEGVTIYAVDGSVLLSDAINELPPYFSMDENESGNMDSLEDLQDAPFIE